ncbi:hypothetical protein H7J07_06730 [Mycobacterium koreense]|nr:hypothetical protein [Mycolicibacillus koreensis]MCV7247914.1 hypothetical protein [Mycolicibacillus koreensis]
MATTSDRIAHSVTIKGTLTAAGKSATAAAARVPVAPVTGLRPSHRAALNKRFRETRKTLKDISKTAKTGVSYLTEDDQHEDKSRRDVESTKRPEYRGK